MRDLFQNELQFVSGACHSPCPPSGRGSSPTPPSKKQKGNNGFGNGGNDPAPGNSGMNNSPNAAQKLQDSDR